MSEVVERTLYPIRGDRTSPHLCSKSGKARTSCLRPMGRGTVLITPSLEGRGPVWRPARIYAVLIGFGRIPRAQRKTRPASPGLLFTQLRVAHSAMVAAVGKVDDQSDHKPDDQTRPVHPPKLVHHVPVEPDPQNRHKRHQRRPKRPWLSRVSAPEHHHRDANNHERE